MPSRFSAPAIGASVLAVSGVVMGCNEHLPTGPAPTSSPPPVSATGPVITSLAPALGTAGTMISINGIGFGPGATVSVDGVETPTYPFERSDIIRLPAPPHPPGEVDVVVINPDGQRATLRNGFRYEATTRDPGSSRARPSITSVSPTVGSTGGGTYVRVTGTSFEPGLTATLGGIIFRPNVLDGEFLVATVPHAAGSVDLVVANPGGESSTLRGGYTFAEPASLSFNGRWEGVAGGHHEFALTFVIGNNLLTSVSCDGREQVLPIPQSTRDGQFSHPVMSGRFVSSEYGAGHIDIAPCGNTTWEAWKRP
jgi:hypothetical protein